MEEVKVIKEKNKNIEVFTPLRKTVLLCTNGFQTTDTHDSLPMKEYFGNNFAKEYQNCEVVTVKLFEPANKKTHHVSYFEKTLESVIEEYIEKDYNIYLMGYSFSCALVTKMARKYNKNILRVILVAPVYDTILNNMIPGYIKYAYKFHKLNKRYGKKVAKAIGRQTIQGLPHLLISIFISILQNRKYFRRLTQDTLLIRGTSDILCTEHSIKTVSNRVKGEHELYLYQNMSHAILKSVKLNGIVYEDILHFCFDTPFYLENNVEVVNEKNEDKIKVDLDGERIPTFGEIFSRIDPDCENYASQQENEF